MTDKGTNLYLRNCETKRFKDDDGIKTELTLDCSDLNQRDFIEYALQSLVIKWQGNARRNALKQEGAVAIPAKAFWKVPKPGYKTVMSIEQAVASLPDEKKLKLLKALQGMLNTGATPEEDVQEGEE